jgi:hypothetical protein
MERCQGLPGWLSQVIAFSAIVQGLHEKLKTSCAGSFADLPHTDAIIHVREIQETGSRQIFHVAFRK